MGVGAVLAAIALPIIQLIGQGIRPCLLLSCLAIPLTSIVLPNYSQRMKNEPIPHRYFAGIRYDLVGVKDRSVEGNASIFLPDHSATVLASGLCGVAVVVINR